MQKLDEPPKAFTLIELLVVISIIVLLVAVLMPTLARARAQARTVVCRSNLGQWALLWGMYVEDNDGRPHPIWTCRAKPEDWPEWLRSFKDY
jgi:prepilin-type N-terminal cleavage/methylation domain-containing protein